MRNKLIFGALLSSALCISNFAVADPIIYIGDINGKLGRVDAATGTATVVGNITAGQMTDIAFDSTGQLWGINFNNLYRIDYTTAASTLVGSFGGPTTLNSLTFGPDGTLYAAGQGSEANLFKLNTTTGSATSIGAMGGSFSSSGDLAFHNGVLYLTSSASPFDNLVSVNTTTGAATLIGSMGVAAEYGIVNAPDGKLYGAAGTNIYTVDATTGATTLISSYAAQGLDIAYGSAIRTEAGFGAPLPSIASSVTVLLTISYVTRKRMRRIVK